MNRQTHFNFIEDKLNTLAYRIESRGKLNILDLHNHSENFWLLFLNKVFGWDFEDANKIQQNVEAIDLIDHTNKIVCQVSATCTKQKIESALEKDIIKNYLSYTFKFISISKDAADLRTKTFKNPNNISFNPITDIIDNKSILDEIKSLTASKQKSIYEFINSELGNDVDIVKFDSNLAIIINVLSKVNFKPSSKVTINVFQIERKITYNVLTASKRIIDECNPYSYKVDQKYNEFDKQGANKSLSVLSAINGCLVEASTDNTATSSDTLFLKVIEKVSDIVISSSNYIEMPIDELELCVKVIVVDAFIRCKIFENPNDYQHVASR